MLGKAHKTVRGSTAAAPASPQPHKSYTASTRSHGLPGDENIAGRIYFPEGTYKSCLGGFVLQSHS